MKQRKGTNTEKEAVRRTPSTLANSTSTHAILARAKGEYMSTTPSVIVYSAEWCAYCKTEKQYLDKLGVSYAVKDIEKTPGAQDELAAKTGGKAQGIPVTDIAGEIVYGFDRARIDELLRAKGLLPEA